MCAQNFPESFVDGPNRVRRTLKSRKNQGQWQIAAALFTDPPAQTALFFVDSRLPAPGTDRQRRRDEGDLEL
jgi:hypothetical protein